MRKLNLDNVRAFFNKYGKLLFAVLFVIFLVKIGCTPKTCKEAKTELSKIETSKSMDFQYQMEAYRRATEEVKKRCP